MKTFLLLCGFILGTLSWHHLLTTVAEMNLNAQSGALEIALHCSPRDLEATLTKENGRPIRCEKEPQLDRLIQTYLEAHFRVEDAEKKAAPFTWVGKELALRDVWIYFQLDVGNSLKNKVLVNDVLANLDHAYMSTVTLDVAKQKRRSFSFTKKTKSQPLLKH